MMDWPDCWAAADKTIAPIATISNGKFEFWRTKVHLQNNTLI